MTSLSPVLCESPSEGGRLASDPQVLIAEARQRQRRRRRRAALLVGVALVVTAVVASAIALASRSGRTADAGLAWPLAGPTRPMPSQVVVWTGGFRVQVLSSRTGHVVRTLATNVALYRGTPTVSVSRGDVVYFDNARDRKQWIESTPLAGGTITTIGPGYMPEISPDGRQLAYVAYTVKIYPPNTPVRDMKSIPEGIVARNLETGAVHTWSFTSAVPDISNMSWSPDSRFLSYTSSDSTGYAETTQLLDTRSGGTLTGARRIPLASGLEWAGFLTARIGLAVAPYPAAQGQQQSLVAVSVRSGRILRRLIRLPRWGLSVGNALDGTEGAITADPTGHYVLIAADGRRGYGEILRWTFATRRLVAVTSGAIRAVWP